MVVYSVRQGLDVTEGKLDLISNIIRKMLKIDCAVLMGANIASDVAQEEFCEATVGTCVPQTCIHMHTYTYAYMHINCKKLEFYNIV